MRKIKCNVISQIVNFLPIFFLNLAAFSSQLFLHHISAAWQEYNYLLDLSDWEWESPETLQIHQQWGFPGREYFWLFPQKLWPWSPERELHFHCRPRSKEPENRIWYNNNIRTLLSNSLFITNIHSKRDKVLKAPINFSCDNKRLY